MLFQHKVVCYKQTKQEENQNARPKMCNVNFTMEDPQGRQDWGEGLTKLAHQCDQEFLYLVQSF